MKKIIIFFIVSVLLFLTFYTLNNVERNSDNSESIEEEEIIVNENENKDKPKQKEVKQEQGQEKKEDIKEKDIVDNKTDETKTNKESPTNESDMEEITGLNAFYEEQYFEEEVKEDSLEEPEEENIKETENEEDKKNKKIITQLQDYYNLLLNKDFTSAYSFIKTSKDLNYTFSVFKNDYKDIDFGEIAFGEIKEIEKNKKIYYRVEVELGEKNIYKYLFFDSEKNRYFILYKGIIDKKNILTFENEQVKIINSSIWEGIDNDFIILNFFNDSLDIVAFGDKKNKSEFKINDEVYYEFDRLRITPGETYSVVISAKDIKEYSTIELTNFVSLNSRYEIFNENTLNIKKQDN